MQAHVMDEIAGAPRREPRSFTTAVARVAALATEHAENVDRAACFPEAAMAALRAEGLLGALIPTRLGGLGLGISAIAAACCTLGQACASTAMIYAMHQIQVASLVRHAGGSAWHEQLLRHVAANRLLIASVTSEVGVGGQMRVSRCAIEQDALSVRVVKHASACSYGAYADAYLLTARRHAEAAEHDQVLLALDRQDVVLERTGGWDPLGMRGTCSEAFVMQARAASEQVLPEPFGRIAAETMVPVSHLLWAALWLGIAIEAVHRARAALRPALRGASAEGGLPAGATRLTLAVEHLQMLQARIAEALARFEAAPQGGNDCLREAADICAVKTSVSEGCLWVVQQAMLACGFAGYQNSGPYSLSRQLRDLQSAPLMISNDRMRESSTRLLLAQRPVLGLQPNPALI